MLTNFTTPSHAGTVSFRQTLAEYRAALNRLTSWGISLSPNSRLKIYERRLAEALENDPAVMSRHDFEALLFGYREIDEVIAMTEWVSDPPTAQERDRLRRLGTGSEHPDFEKHSAGRDLQYELYLAAALSRAGMSVRLGEPDITICTASGPYPLEAKRPKSLARLDDRLREAVQQLAQHSQPGVVALSVDHVVRPKTHYLRLTSPDAMGAAGDLLIDQAQELCNRRIRDRMLGRNIAAVMLTLRVPCTFGDPLAAALITRWRVQALLPATHAGYAVVDEFRRILPHLQ